jgi:hypothetical protein
LLLAKVWLASFTSSTVLLLCGLGVLALLLLCGLGVLALLGPLSFRTVF